MTLTDDNTTKAFSPWSEAEDAVLREHYPIGGTRACAPLLPQRSKLAVKNRAGIILKLRAPQSTAWTPERETLFKQMWQSSTPVATMIKTFGGAFTASAIGGKARRLGLPPRRAERKVEQPKPIRRNSIIQQPKPNGVTPVCAQPPERSAAEIPVNQRKGLLELGPFDCRFPYGHPGEVGFFFCGGIVEFGQPYCPFHCCIAYQRASVRERRAA